MSIVPSVTRVSRTLSPRTLVLLRGDGPLCLKPYIPLTVDLCTSAAALEPTSLFLGPLAPGIGYEGWWFSRRCPSLVPVDAYTGPEARVLKGPISGVGSPALQEQGGGGGVVRSVFLGRKGQEWKR